MKRLIARNLASVLVLACIAFAALQARWQRADEEYVAEQARAVVAGLAPSKRAYVEALRDHVRSHVTWHGVAQDGRPFLRASASEVLRSGAGYCGEVTRLFISMASAVGIHAERINIYGATPHVVAVVSLDGVDTVVDCQDPPQFRELMPFYQALAQSGQADYSTINLRRLHLSWLAPRLKLNLGPASYWLENPNALAALLAVALAAVILFLRAVFWLAPRILRRLGWVHISELRGSHLDPADDAVPSTSSAERT